MEPREGAATGEGGGGPAAATGIARLQEKFKPGVKATLLISLVFYLAMLIVGCLGAKKCPVNPNIPLFLIVTGVIGLISKLLSVIKEKVNPFFEARYLESSMYTIELAFLLIGSYWVYQAYKPGFDPTDRYYCQKTVYMFAFLYVTIVYALLFVMLVGFMCFLFCICFLKKVETDQADPEAQVHIQQSEDPHDKRKDPTETVKQPTENQS